MQSLSRKPREAGISNRENPIGGVDDTFVVDVLVVDDDEDVRMAIAEFLDEEGYAVAVADNGQEALDLLRGGLRPRLLMTDLRMPIMDGWQLLAIRPAHHALADVPVLVVTGEAERPLFRHGICAVVEKPVDVERVLALVEETLAPTHSDDRA
jgi:CheY-like chemotaxis protein